MSLKIYIQMKEDQRKNTIFPHKMSDNEMFAKDLNEEFKELKSMLLKIQKTLGIQ